MALTRVGSKGLAPGAVDPNDIAANAIIEAKIADGAVTPNKISGEVPVTKGGTGAASLTANAVLLGNGTSAVATVSAGDTGNVLTSDGTAWISKGISAGGNLGVQVYTANATWTKPDNLKAVRVIVVGGGGGAASGLGVAPTHVGSTGGTSSFGAFASATGGTGGQGGVSGCTPLSQGGNGGTGSGGNVNITGGMAGGTYDNNPGDGGSTFLGMGGAIASSSQRATQTAINGGGGGAVSSNPSSGGGGGGGTSILYLTAPNIPGPVSITVGLGGAGAGAAPAAPGRQAGANGIVVVEEFY